MGTLNKVLSLAGAAYYDRPLNATPEAIGGTATLLYGWRYDNSQNVNSHSYLKLWTSASSPSPGGVDPKDIPSLVWRTPKGMHETVPLFVLGSADAFGMPATFQSSGVFYAGALTAGGTAGSTAPSGTVRASFWTDGG